MSLQDLFYPSGVVIVGSMAEGKLGFEILNQIISVGYTNLFICNPKSQGALGINGYKSIMEINAQIDVAVIASPVETVPLVLEECGMKGIGYAVIITSGFSEVGNLAGEQEIIRIARKYGIRVIGPNCAGVLNSHHKLFATLETRPPAGKMAVISQSGAIGGAILSWAEDQGVGISKFISYGNRSDLDELEILPYLAEDPETSVVALYIESVSNGKLFRDIVTDFTCRKPLVILKSGRSIVGKKAALSHTGSLAGSDMVFTAIFQESGALRVETIEELFDLCKGFVFLPPMRGQKIAIVTNSGGPGILAADKAESSGLEVGEVSLEIKHLLHSFLPAFCAVNNPIDLTVQGNEEGYKRTLDAVCNEFDAALAINVATPYLDSVSLARGIVAAAANTQKPIAVNFMAGKNVVESIQYLKEHFIPVFPSGERAITVLAKMAQYESTRSETRNKIIVPLTVGKLPKSTEGEFLEPEAMDWLKANHFPVPDFHFATNLEDAIAESNRIGFPLVMKVVSPDIIHKSEFGGVILNIQDETEVRHAYAKLRLICSDKFFRGVMVYPMLKGKVEILLGISTDPQFGPMVILGLGGIYTEIFKDTTLHSAPVSLKSGYEMIKGLKSYPIFGGYRGQDGCNLDLLADLIVRLSELPFQFPEISELDLNPVFLSSNSITIGDVRVILRSIK